MASHEVAPQPSAFDQLKTGWNGFLTRLSTDKDMQQAMLGFGTELLNSESTNPAGGFADVGTAFQNSQQSLTDARAGRLKATQDADDRARSIKAGDADLANTIAKTGELGASTELKTAQAAKARRPTEIKPTDTTRLADAMVDVGKFKTRSEALVNIAEAKSGISRSDYALQYVTDGLGDRTVAEGQAVWDDANRTQLTQDDIDNSALGEAASGAVQGTLDSLKPQVPVPLAPDQAVSPAQLAAEFPQLNQAQIQAILNNPEALAELNALR